MIFRDAFLLQNADGQTLPPTAPRPMTHFRPAPDLSDGSCVEGTITFEKNFDATRVVWLETLGSRCRVSDLVGLGG